MPLLFSPGAIKIKKQSLLLHLTSNRLLLDKSIVQVLTFLHGCINTYYLPPVSVHKLSYFSPVATI